MSKSPKSNLIAIFTAIALAVLALIALNNATSTESLVPLAIVCAAGLIAMGLSENRKRD